MPLWSGRVAPASEERAAVITVGLGEVLVRLGFIPVSAVVPSLAAELGVSAADGAWILTVFILALAGSLLVAGRLGDFVGHRRVFALGAAIYAVTSALIAVATGFAGLLILRAGQGVGAAMVSGNNLAILARAVPVERRGRAIGVVVTGSSLFTLISAGAAPAMISLGYWPLLFVSTAPLALWAALRARRLPEHSDGEARAPIDWSGALLLVLVMTLLAVVLNHPHTSVTEAVMPVFHAGIPALALLAAGAFVLVERRVAIPLLDWRWLREKVFAASVGVNMVLHLTMLATMFLGPVLVVRGLGMSSAAGAVLLVVTQATAMVTAYLGGWVYDRTGVHWLRPIAAAALGASFLGWALAGLAGSYAGLLGAGVVGGLASGVLLAVNNAVIMASLPAEARGVASGMLETTRHFGHALGVTISTAILALFLVGATEPGAESRAYRSGFAWASVAMAVIAAGGAALAGVRPRASRARV